MMQLCKIAYSLARWKSRLKKGKETAASRVKHLCHSATTGTWMPSQTDRPNGSERRELKLQPNMFNWSLMQAEGLHPFLSSTAHFQWSLQKPPQIVLIGHIYCILIILWFHSSSSHSIKLTLFICFPSIDSSPAIINQWKRSGSWTFVQLIS